jgi:deoxyribodipyrimidine photo-lyase
MRTVVWFRGKDLRLIDHVPLLSAIAGGEVVPLFVVDPFFFAPERARELPHRMQFLVESLAELATAIHERGSRLLFVAGKSVDVVPQVAATLHADRVVAYRWSEPFGILRDGRVAAGLAKEGIGFTLFEGETLASPGEVRTSSGTPFSVFTPFARVFERVVSVQPPRGAPRRLPPLPTLPRELRRLLAAQPMLAAMGLVRNDGIASAGERAARLRLARFLRGAGAAYERGRDELGAAGTSRLSQDLKFGTLSARAVWRAAHDGLRDLRERVPRESRGLAAHPRALRAFANELLWREFAYDVLRSKPHVLDRPFRSEWERFPWRRDRAAFGACQSGATGYPLVDASARQLLAEGFVHNRARMISASFLCKDLLIDFRLGEAHYMKYLTDGDWASNDLGWQWSAGCGVDAQPWFRVFNPVTQGRRFDPEGGYVRRYLPELARLPSRWVHEPWSAPAAVLAKAGVDLGRSYPWPIVQHAPARGRFLAAATDHLEGAS